VTGGEVINASLKMVDSVIFTQDYWMSGLHPSSGVLMNTMDSRKKRLWPNSR
jgi:hypothetical protein